MQSRAPRPGIRAVVLDAMGVIYEAGDDVQSLLIPFARERGCKLPDEEIAHAYTVCSLGKTTSADFWQALGIESRESDLDHVYLDRHRLNAGLKPFLARLLIANFQVGCVSNDVSEWSRKLRAFHDLERYIPHWVVSGDVGARKPSFEIYHRFAAITGLNPRDCLFVDDRIQNLAAAEEVGFRTLLFSLSPHDEESNRELAVGFEDIWRWLHVNG